MFHQIGIRTEDRRYQRLYWRETTDELVKTYEMKVMTFGANCSPCIAQFVKDKNAKIFKDGYPEAATAIMKNFNVDDWLQSFKTPKEAVDTAFQVMDIQRHAGFGLHKWATNSPKLRQELETSGHSVKPNGITTKALGVEWNQESHVDFPHRIPHKRRGDKKGKNKTYHATGRHADL